MSSRQEQQFRAEYIRYALMRLPQQEKLRQELKDAEKIVREETSRKRIDYRPPEEKPSILHREDGHWRVKFPSRILKRMYRGKIRRVDEVWFAAEKEELARYLPPTARRYDRFVRLIGVGKIETAKGRLPKSVWRRLTGELKLDLPRDKEGNVLVPRELWIVADPNPAGSFFAETLGLVVRALDEQYRGETRREKQQSLPKVRVVVVRPHGGFVELKSSDYSVDARRFIVRTLFDQVYNRVAGVVAKLVDGLGLFPKKRAVLNRLRGLVDEAGEDDKAVLKRVIRLVEDDRYDEALRVVREIQDGGLRKRARRAVLTRFVLTDVGRVALLTLSLLDDLEHESTLVLRVPELGGEFRLPVNAIVMPDDVGRVRVGLTVEPLEGGVMHHAVSHDEAVRWLVSRGLSTDDAEMVLERLWLRGYISYPRNNGNAVDDRDRDRLAEALGEMGIGIDDGKLDTGGDPGLYPLKLWDSLTGVEREFMDWLAGQVAMQRRRCRVTADVRIGRISVDYRAYTAMLPVSGGVDGVYVPVRVESGVDGVSLERLVEAAQELGVGTEATRSSILGNLRDLGLVSMGERIRLTHNGRIIAVLARAAFPYATDADKVRGVMKDIDEWVKCGDSVDEILARALRRIVVVPEKFVQRAADRLYGFVVPEEETTRDFGFVDRCVLFAYLTYLTRGRWPTRRDFRRTYIRSTNESEIKRRFGLLESSGFFEVVPGKRKDSVVYRLNEAGVERARQLYELARRYSESGGEKGRHVTDVYEHLRERGLIK